jgi:hypothetical protein
MTDELQSGLGFWQESARKLEVECITARCKMHGAKAARSVAIGLGQRLVHGSPSGVALWGGTGLLLTAFCQQPPRMSFPHRLAEKSSFENGPPDHYVRVQA